MTITAPAPAAIRRAAAPMRTAPTQRPATLNAEALMRLGFVVDRDGIAAHEDAAQAVVDAATRKGIRPILVEILADRREPAVARQRAFGRLTLALAG